MPAFMGLSRRPCRRRASRRPTRCIALTRSSPTSPAGAGGRDHRDRRPGRGDRRRRAQFVVSAACLLAARRARARGLRRRGARRRSSRCCAWAGARCARGRGRCGLVAMAGYHVFVLPAVLVLGPTLAERDLRRRVELGDHVARSASARSRGTSSRLRLPVRRPGSSPRPRSSARAQAAASAAGSAPPGSPCSRSMSGVCVSLFFTLWDTSIQEQVPPSAISRVRPTTSPPLRA